MYQIVSSVSVPFDVIQDNSTSVDLCKNKCVQKEQMTVVYLKRRSVATYKSKMFLQN